MAAAVGRVHYRLKTLERARLVRRVRTREVRGVLEKYYRASAREFEVSPDLLRGSARRALGDVALRYLRTMYRQARKAIETIAARRPAATGAEMRRRYPAVVSRATVDVTPAELRRLFGEVSRAVKRRGGGAAKGRRAYTLWTVGHPTDPSEP